MANLTDADLTSEMIDLTMFSLTELRDLTTPDLTAALNRTYALAEFNTGNELQDQNT